MPSAATLAKKSKYFDRLLDLVTNAKDTLLVGIDHVGSKQMQNIRIKLRGKAELLMGKNTMIRRGLAKGHAENPDVGLDKLRDAMVGRQGFIFTTSASYEDIKALLNEHRVQAAAKVGQISQVDTTLPAGPTGMDPSQTSFFQALNIGTKIVKGQIELTSAFQILKVGDKVSPSAAILLGKLNIKPFEYGMTINSVFLGGCVMDAAVLEISDDDMINKCLAGVRYMAAFSREVGVPTEASIPHALSNAFKNVASLVAKIDFDFDEVKDVKAFIADPSAFQAANAAAATDAPAASAAADAPAAAAPEEEEEEDHMDFDLFG